MHNYDEGDWLAQRLDALRPGWRGRVSLRVTDESGAGAVEELIGTIIGEPSLDPATADDDAVIDATATLCFNYHNGRFGPVAGEPCMVVRASRITDMQAM